MTLHKVYLTGAEIDTQRQTLIDAGSKAVSISYPHFRRNSKAKQTDILQMLQDLDISVMLDSGSDYQIKKIQNHNDFSNLYEQSVYSYMEYVDNNSQYFDIVNTHTPIDTFVNPELTHIQEYSGICENYIFTTNILNLDKDYLQDLVRSLAVTTDFYIGLTNQHSVGDYRRYINGSKGFYRNKNIKFMCHGVSNSSFLRYKLFNFITTNSWLSGALYKAVYRFRGTSLDRIIDTTTDMRKKQSIKMQIKRQVLDAGVDWDAFVNDDFNALNLWNATQFTLWQQKEFDRVNKAPRNELVQSKPIEFRLTQRKENTMPKDKLVKYEKDEVALDKLQRKAEYLSQAITKINRMCDTCSFQDDCPAFTPGSDCLLESDYNIDDEVDLDMLIERQLSLRSTLVERANLGQKLGHYTLDEVESLATSLTNDMIKYKKVKQKQPDLMIQASTSGVSALTGLFGALMSQGQQKGQSNAANTIEMDAMQKETEQIIKDNKSNVEEISDADFTDDPQ